MTLHVRPVSQTAEAVKTPAARLIERFGVEALAEWTGRHRGRIYAWTWPKSRGGTGGLVPHTVRHAIIAGAAAKGAAFAFSDFEPLEGEAYLRDDEVAA